MQGSGFRIWSVGFRVQDLPSWRAALMTIVNETVSGYKVCTGHVLYSVYLTRTINCVLESYRVRAGVAGRGGSYKVCRAQGSAFRVQGFGFRVEGVPSWRAALMTVVNDTVSGCTRNRTLHI